MRATSFILALVLGLLTAESAYAYKYKVCEALGDSKKIKLPSNSKALRSGSVSFPAGVWLDGLNNAIAQFNKNPSPFRFSRVTDSGGLALGNGQSEVWGSDDQGILQGAPAIAYTYSDCYWFFGITAQINEGDTIFDFGDPFRWTPTRTKSAIKSYIGSAGKRLLQGTAVHEFGHVTGLKHENRFYNVMGSDTTHLDTSGSTVNAYVGEDSGSGLVSLYGLNNSGIQDLAVAHWRYLGVSGEYSSHARTRIFTTGGIELGKSTVDNEPRYNVTRGNSVSVEFTFENLGKSTQNSAPIKYYISTNDIISTGDRLVRTSSASLTRNTPATDTRNVTIPADLAATTNYWLGIIISMPPGVTDGNSANSTSYIRIRTN